MNCPSCGKPNSDSASFCIFCGNPLAISNLKGSTSRFKGSLSGSITSKEKTKMPHHAENAQDNEDDLYSAPSQSKLNKEPIADVKKPSRVVDASGLKSTIGMPHPPKKAGGEEVAYAYCKTCGRKLRKGEKCPDCNLKTKVPNDSRAVKVGKKPNPWPIVAGVAAILVLVIGILSIKSRNRVNTTSSVFFSEHPYVTDNSTSNDAYEAPPDIQSDPLSTSCDYVLCVGYDQSNNKYELVANQSESSRGFEILVGVIKNNSWLYPLSADFPFLAEDGLFHVSVSMAGKSGTALQNPNSVIQNIYFIDTGAFLMDCYKANNSLSIYDHTYIVFSCTTLQSYTVNCSDTILLYRYSEPEFSGGYLLSYGEIFTDNGKLVMYTETSGTSSGWTEDQVFRWDVLDTQMLTTTTIASNVKGIRPRSMLSEGLFFCTDKRFYNIDGQPAIDLTDYGIDVWNSGDIFFEGGTCTFEVKNSLGTRFLITVDTSGNLISEQQA